MSVLDLSKLITSEDKAEAKALQDATEYQRLRQSCYPSSEELMAALWEHVIEGRPEAAKALQARRLAVKAKYPKVKQEA